MEGFVVRKSTVKLLFGFVGFLSFVLGTIGIILPVLPTTPFYLLSAFCFTRSSKRLDRWFKSTKLYKRHLETFATQRCLTLKSKLAICIPVVIMLTLSAIIVNHILMTIVIVIIIAFKLYYFIFKITTIKASAETMNLEKREKETL